MIDLIKTLRTEKMSNEKEHLLDILIRDYYRICEINSRVPILIEYKAEISGTSRCELNLSINRKPAGVYHYQSIEVCKDSVVDHFFIKGIEAHEQQHNRPTER